MLFGNRGSAAGCLDKPDNCVDGWLSLTVS